MRTGKQSHEGLVVRSAVFSSLWISGCSISVSERPLSVVPWLTSMHRALLMYRGLEVNSPLYHPSPLTVRGTLNHLDPFSYFEKPLPYPGASFVSCGFSGTAAEEFGAVSGAALRLQHGDTELNVPECARDKF